MREIEGLRKHYEDEIRAQEEHYLKVIDDDKKKCIEIIQKMQKNKHLEIEAEINSRMEAFYLEKDENQKYLQLEMKQK